MHSEKKEMSEDVKKFLESECISSADVDMFLDKYAFSAKQLRDLAELIVEKIVFDGNNIASRRALCRARILHGMTLRRLALVSSVDFQRLSDIESGASDYIRLNECRAINEIFGLKLAADTPDVFMEPSGNGFLVKLSDMSTFDNFKSLEQFAEKYSYQKFEDGCIPGVHGVVISCRAGDIGIKVSGDVYIQVSELLDVNSNDVYLCGTSDRSYCIVEEKNGIFCTLEEKKFTKADLIWFLPVRQIVFKANDRSLSL